MGQLFQFQPVKENDFSHKPHKAWVAFIILQDWSIILLLVSFHFCFLLQWKNLLFFLFIYMCYSGTNIQHETYNAIHWSSKMLKPIDYNTVFCWETLGPGIFFFFLWIPLGTHHLTVQVHPSWHWHSPIAITPAARMMHPAMSQMLRNGPKNMTKSSRRLHGLLIPPDHKPVDHPWVVPGLCDSWRPYITTHRAQRIRQKTLQSWWSLIHGGASMYRTCCHEGVYSVYVI